MNADNASFDPDVVIVGAGIAGALIAHKLAKQRKKVLILEAGGEIPVDFNGFMKRFLTAPLKVPESPYPPDLFTDGKLTDPATINAGRPTVLSLQQENWQDPKQSYLIQKGPKAFGSTYERTGGGTSLHWLGTSLRFLPTDFQMVKTFGKGNGLPPGFADWPITYSELSPKYEEAEHAIGVSADVKDQTYLGVTFREGYAYPMPKIPASMVDKAVEKAVGTVLVGGKPLRVMSTPAARNSQPYQSRRVCAGNTNCIPICPIQAKYDPTVTLNEAVNTGRVKIMYRTVAKEILVDESGRVSGIRYLQYKDDRGDSTGNDVAKGKVYVIAAHAIETPKLLLMSTNNGRTPDGVANRRSKAVGKFLMDHPYYVAWGRTPNPVWAYRGPLSTSGIESARDGEFRSERGAFRVDVGNESAFPAGEPFVSTLDFINGTNKGIANEKGESLFGRALVTRINDVVTRQFRLGFLVEQSPDASNRVTLSNHKDHLGLPRPQIAYDLSPYTVNGLVEAKKTAMKIFKALGGVMIEPAMDAKDPSTIATQIDGKPTLIQYFGSGHIVGTYRMGTSPDNSVVNSKMRSWEHENLFLVGSGVFPTVATANPTLTLSALCLRAADEMLDKDLA